MLIEVIKDRVPHLGVMGTRRDIPPNEARVHILLGNAVAVTEVKPPKPARRQYKRRDIQPQPRLEVEEKPVDTLEDLVSLHSAWSGDSE